GRGGEHYQVHFVGEVADAGIGLDTQHIGTLGIHREHRAAEWAAKQVPQHRTAYAARPFRRADYRDALGKKQGIERMAFRAVNVGRRIALDDALTCGFGGRNRGHACLTGLNSSLSLGGLRREPLATKSRAADRKISRIAPCEKMDRRWCLQP